MIDKNYSLTFIAPNPTHGTKDGKMVSTSSGSLEPWNRLHQTPSSFPTPPLCQRPSEPERAPSVPDRTAIKKDSIINKDDQERYVPAILPVCQEQEGTCRTLSASIPVDLNDRCSVIENILKIWISL